MNDEVTRILGDAGWQADPGWGGFTNGTCVGGLAPDGNVYVKNWAGIPPGHPKHSEDTPDTPEEAAQWLADRYKAPRTYISEDVAAPVEEPPVNPLALDGLQFGAAPKLEDAMAQPININVAPVFNVGGSHSESGATQRASPVNADAGGHDEYGNRQETLADEVSQHPESEQASQAPEAVSDFVGFGDNPTPGEDHGSAEDGPTSGGGALQPYDGQDGPGDSEREYAFDADYEEAGEDLGAELLDDEAFAKPALDAPEPEDFAPDEMPPVESSAQDRFIGLDDLDRRRSLRIGDVIRYANTIMPSWLPADDILLASLRNFTMGVSEGRWPDSPAQRSDLDGLEATLARINQIKNARDAKVEFLEGATREQVEGFMVEADWP